MLGLSNSSFNILYQATARDLTGHRALCKGVKTSLRSLVLFMCSRCQTDKGMLCVALLPLGGVLHCSLPIRRFADHAGPRTHPTRGH